MNLNILGYILYFTMTLWIIIYVGKLLYHSGNQYVGLLIPEHTDICMRTNNILRTGYYLLNIGYCATTLIHWNQIENLSELLGTLTDKIATILIIIGILHYLNILIITKFIKKLIH